MAIVTRGISSSKSGKEAGSTPNAEITHPHKSVLEPKKSLRTAPGQEEIQSVLHFPSPKLHFAVQNTDFGVETAAGQAEGQKKSSR